MQYALHILILVEIFAIAAISYDLVAGQGGLLSLAHAAFFGLGAYIAALLSLNSGTTYTVELIISMLAAAMMSLAISLPSIRLRGDYFMMTTFGFQLIFFVVINNWTEVTGGPSGLPGIPLPSIAGITVTPPWGFIVLGAGQLLITYFIFGRLVRSPFGRILRGIREDELFVQGLGKNTNSVKIVAFALSAAFAASAGVLFAHYLSFINPTSFTVNDSILILTMVIVGGAGTVRGPILGAVILVTLPELFRFVGLPSASAANVHQAMYGAALIILMILRPQGLVGRFSFVEGNRPAS